MLKIADDTDFPRHALDEAGSGVPLIVAVVRVRFGWSSTGVVHRDHAGSAALIAMGAIPALAIAPAVRANCLADDLH